MWQLQHGSQEVGRYEWGVESGGPVICTLCLNGGVDVEGVHKLHNAVEVVLTTYNHASVHKVDQSLKSKKVSRVEANFSYVLKELCQIFNEF